MGWFARKRLAEALRQGLMGFLKLCAGSGPLVLLFVAPLFLSLVLLAPNLFEFESFNALFAHPQFYGALKLSLFTGIISTLLALAFAIIVVMAAAPKLLSRSGMFLALPHLALALGLGFVLASTGLLARVLVGGTSPPDWQLVQDATGLGLIAALVLKEAPFLVWAMVTIMQSDALRLPLQQQASVARSLGHGPQSIFFKIVLPQVLSRVVWPIVAVFSYGMTVVDMALVIGPAQPPTLAQLLWTELNDGEIASNARGAAGTILLSGLIAVALLLVLMVLKSLRPLIRYYITQPAKTELNISVVSTALWRLLILIYALIIFALLLQSVSQLWPYPALTAENYSLQAWSRAFKNLSPLVLSLILGVFSSLVAILASVTWFETQRPQHDKIVLAASLLMLCLPSLLVALGQYRLLLQMGLTGTGIGLFLAHLLPVTAYVFIMLHGPYRGYDTRWQSVGNGLGTVRLKFLRQVKWTMLKAPLLSAAAVGFAVSVAQFVPAQLAAAGRYSTLPMEAVTLSSGGNRALISVYGLLLMLLPLLGFGLGAWLSKSRWHDA